VPRPSIAVVVPVLNEQGQLPALLGMLDSLGADEVVIVDGGSTDGTGTILAEGRSAWLTCRPGRARQMNAGAAGCKSDILLFIHADTKVTSNHLLAVRKVMSDEEVVGGRFDVRLSGSPPAFRIIEWFINIRSRLTGISTGDQCQFVRRELFERMGGYPEQPLMEDIEFARHLKRAGRIACLRDKVTTSSRRWEQHGVFRTVLLMWKLRLYYWLGVTPERLAAFYRNAR